MVTAISELIEEQQRLNNAANEGKLDVRGNVNKFKGSYSEIINGTNSMLDAVITPINEAKQVLGKMAVNDYTLEMTGQYKGMFNEFAEAIINVRTRLLSVQDYFYSIFQR